MADKKYSIDFTMSDGTTESVEFTAPQGERGTGTFKVTTAPSSYTTATGGFTPTYRIALSTVRTQAKVDKVLVGDVLIYSYYHYAVGYVDSSYVYLAARTSFRGAAGKTAYAYAQDGGYTGTEAEFSTLLANGVDKRNVTLGLHTDGLIYLFIDGSPVGNGIALPSGATGDVVGNVDSANNIVLMGNLADGNYSVKYEKEDGSTIDIGELKFSYSVKNTLTNCTNSNKATSVANGGSYSATITANSGYELKSLVVTMGGSTVSVSGGVINIAKVTGDIVITAVAEVYVPSYTNLFNPSTATLNQRVNSSGGLTALNGHLVTEFINVSNKVPFTNTTKIYVKGATFDKASDNNIRAKVLTYKIKPSSGYTGIWGEINKNTGTVTDEGNGVVSICGENLAKWMGSEVTYIVLVLNVKTTAITQDDIKDMVITIDEPIA